MTFHINVFRLNRGSYTPYTVYFKDVSGLAQKADVKIAGVKVGWIEDIKLINDGLEAEAGVMLSNDYVLRNNSYAVVRQDGLLGSKYLEIIPGDPLLPSLPSGAALGKPSQTPASIDDLLSQFRLIAENVEGVTGVLKDVFGGADGRQILSRSIKNIDTAVERFASVAESLDRTLQNNESNINDILLNFRDFSSDAKNILPGLRDDIRRVADKLDSEVFPSFQESMEKISTVFDRDFNRVATKLEDTTVSLEDAALQARESFKSIGSVTQKIDEGRGLLGKLVNEEETYQDIRVAAQGLKNYFSAIDSLGIVFDSHVESMYRPAENFKFEDAKGYFGLRIHPSQDYFYLVQLMGNLKGTIARNTSYRSWYDTNDRAIDPASLSTIKDQLRFAPKLEETIVKRDTWKFGLQIGKIFNNLAVRAGLFEGTVGFGLDYDIPFKSDAFRWVTSFEMFDFRGRDRLNDTRPHLKWLNRMFFLRNLYFAFGADDFISKNNANAFFGVGIRFSDDDVKYLLSKVSA